MIYKTDQILNCGYFRLLYAIAKIAFINARIIASLDFISAVKYILGCRDGAVVRALASHQCGPGSIPRLGVICGLSLLFLFSALRGFSPIKLQRSSQFFQVGGH